MMSFIKHLIVSANRVRAWKTRKREANVPSRERRKGSALILTLVLTLSLASLATSAIYLGSNSQILATTYDNERDLRYAAEAMLAQGKSTLNDDPYAAPNTGYTLVKDRVQIMGADNLPVPGITASMYVGPTSSNTGQFGRFVSVVAVVKNQTGAQVVRRLELAQESFAKFAYWSNQESNNGQTIFFNNNDQLWGPVWSNDQINIGSGRARFHGDVGTAKTIAGIGYGTFDKGYSQNQKVISLPSNTVLAALQGYATAGGFEFDAPNSLSVDQTMERIEFIAKPLNGGAFGAAINGADDGFLRAYVSTNGPAWLRGDYTPDNCGASYVFTNNPGPGSPAQPMFVPLSLNTEDWFKNALTASPVSYDVSGLTGGTAAQREQATMGQATARCYLGGDPHLRAANLYGTNTYSKAISKNDNSTQTALALAGTDTTFTASGPKGFWLSFPGSVNATVDARWPAESQYLFPLYRGLNPGTKGVIYVNGTIGISGNLRGRVTLYATGNVAVLGDTKYVTDPSLNLCSDILGVIAGNNIFVADNALQDPPNVAGIGYRNMDDTKDVFLQGVMMALNTAFGAENFTGGPNNVNGCEGTSNGRGCLYLTGGIIQQQRGAVGLSDGTGFAKRYSYDQCALYNPPPYFPTTGRYTDNRYYEIDPSGFDIASLYKALTPGP